MVNSNWSIFVFSFILLLSLSFLGLLVIIVLFVCLGHFWNSFCDKLVGGFCLWDEKVLVYQLLSKTLDFFSESTTGSIESIFSTICPFNFIQNLFFFNSTHGIFIVSDVTFWWIEVLATSLTHYLETRNLWFVMVNLWRKNHSLWIMLQELMWKRSSEKCSINVDIFEFRNINLFTSWAVNLESRYFHIITHTNWDDLLSIA